METQKVAVLITGCSSGIGRALCNEFYNKGCRVIATARKIETLDGLFQKQRKIHRKSFSIVT